MKSILLAALLFPLAAMAQAPGEAQSCAACHGANGEGNATQGSPRIAGQPASYLERQLDAYANGSRTNAVMAPIAKGLSEAQRKSLAQHYSQIVLNPPNTLRASTPSPLGRHIATVGDGARGVQNCEGCHGPGGIGANNTTPLLAGQPTKYLVSALEEWKSGKRKTDPTLQMNHVAGQLTQRDIQALADYFGDQTPPDTAVREVKARVARAPEPRQGVSAGGTAPTQRGSRGASGEAASGNSPSQSGTGAGK